jgi:hypothetical protein
MLRLANPANWYIQSNFGSGQPSIANLNKFAHVDRALGPGCRTTLCVSHFWRAEKTSIESHPLITLAHGPRIIRLHAEAERQILAKRITLAAPNG